MSYIIAQLTRTAWTPLVIVTHKLTEHSPVMKALVNLAAHDGDLMLSVQIMQRVMRAIDGPRG